MVAKQRFCFCLRVWSALGESGRGLMEPLWCSQETLCSRKCQVVPKVHSPNFYSSGVCRVRYSGVQILWFLRLPCPGPPLRIHSYAKRAVRCPFQVARSPQDRGSLLLGNAVGEGCITHKRPRDSGNLLRLRNSRLLALTMGHGLMRPTQSRDEVKVADFGRNVSILPPQGSVLSQSDA